MSVAIRWSLTEIRRLVIKHAIDPKPIADALGLADVATLAIDLEGSMPDTVDELDRQAAVLILGILIRLETRCNGDSGAIRTAFDRPLDAMCGATISEALSSAPDTIGLDLIRDAVGALPLPPMHEHRAADAQFDP